MPRLSPAEVNIRVLLAVAVVVVAVRLVGWLLARIGQPRVLGEIVAGIVLGPSLLGLLLPGVAAYLFPAQVIDAMRVLAQLGLVMFMALIGLEFDTGPLRGRGRTVAVVAQASIAVPFLLAGWLALAVHERFGEGVDVVGFSLFLGAAMAVTAFPVLARLLQESGLIHTRMGSVSLACAAVNDVVAWCLVAVAVAVTGGTGPDGAITTIGFAALYTVAMLAVVRPLLARRGPIPMWAVLLLSILSAWVAERIGIHAIFGGFLAGLVLPRDRQWRKTVHGRLDPVVTSLLLPVFFVVVGLSTRIDQLTGAAAWLLLAVVVVAVVGKFGGSALAARLAGERWPDALTLGVLMNTRGITEIVILSVGLQIGIISSTVFTVMVLMALVTTLMAAPLLRWTAGRRLGGAQVIDDGA